MINYNKICVFDFETDGSDPKSCSPVQIAAVIIDPLKLEIVPNSEFNIFFKPEVLANDEDYQYTTDILDFHAKVRGSSKEAILAEWKKYPSQDQSWKLFTNYLTMHHSRSSKKSQFSAPIAAGYNINKEDRSDIFYPRDVLDIMNLVFYWFENNSDLKNLSLDTLRDYLGINKEGAHDALKDVKDCAEILVRFMRLHRNLGNKIKFKDSFQSPTSHA